MTCLPDLKRKRDRLKELKRQKKKGYDKERGQKVFGDYYHFQHRHIGKRSLSGHHGVHARLLSEPQVL
ncbi:hypothetical protein QTP70_030701 [Hemibagrus guttatus]|uniref:Peptidase S8 pro-domain domain-containing protein n=1 Tax=Hemibagrus guttatus TaxID=175788 RepID=A0AAE0QNX4_9TELE|nr:hypothetical protein QTP70_030701 [Hemibagrus guttatus]